MSFFGVEVVDFFAFTGHVVGSVIGEGVSHRDWGEGGRRQGQDGSVMNSSDGVCVVDVRGERVQRAVERDITWAQGRKRGDQATLLHEATVWGGDKPRMGTKGTGDEVDGVANVVVEACLGVPRAIEEVIPMGINELAAGARRTCGGGEKM